MSWPHPANTLDVLGRRRIPVPAIAWVGGTPVRAASKTSVETETGSAQGDTGFGSLGVSIKPCVTKGDCGPSNRSVEHAVCVLFPGRACPVNLKVGWRVQGRSDTPSSRGHTYCTTCVIEETNAKLPPYGWFVVAMILLNELPRLTESNGNDLHAASSGGSSLSGAFGSSITTVFESSVFLPSSPQPPS